MQQRAGLELLVLMASSEGCLSALLPGPGFCLVRAGCLSRVQPETAARHGCMGKQPDRCTETALGEAREDAHTGCPMRCPARESPRGLKAGVKSLVWPEGACTEGTAKPGVGRAIWELLAMCSSQLQRVLVFPTCLQHQKLPSEQLSGEEV